MFTNYYVNFNRFPPLALKGQHYKAEAGPVSSLISQTQGTGPRGIPGCCSLFKERWMAAITDFLICSSFNTLNV